MAIQIWYCEGCDVAGRCVIPLGADVYTAVAKLRESHRNKSVICDGLNNVGKLRIKAPSCSNQEWRQIRRNGHEKFANQATLKRERVGDGNQAGR